MKKNISTKVCFILIIIGLLILLYPSFSNYFNQIGAAEAVGKYNEVTQKLTNEETEQIIKNAEIYNREISAKALSFANGEPQSLEYLNTLNITEDGMMGYITISKIGVNLPIYHGTTNEILSKAVGHLEKSSLPVGGASTHSILTGHRGLPTAKLFTELDKMEIGDIFTITILNKILSYQVDEINTVTPNELNNLEIVPNEDYITLVTCTPYAINTHRLLVRGKRIENIKEQIITTDAIIIDKIIISFFISLITLTIIFIVYMLYPINKKFVL